MHDRTCHARGARMTQIQENIRDSESGTFGLAKSNKIELTDSNVSRAGPCIVV